jgi:Tfp pilus assembly protein PilN
MRPVNLIPAEERRGEQAPLRTGALVYLVIGACVAILVGVTAMVLMSNKIADGEGEVTQLQREDAAVRVQAQRLASYTQFKILSEQRVQTVSSLADSRFDWERVMRELSLVLPSDVWLVDLTATAAPGVSVGGSSGGSSGGGLRSSAPGPALELNGCATGQQSVAGFIASLKDIDGVTRVGIESSEVAGKESGAGVSAGGDSGSGGAGEDCRTRDFIAKFQIVVAFDAAPVPITSSTEEAAPAPPAEEAESSTASEETAGS